MHIQKLTLTDRACVLHPEHQYHNQEVTYAPLKPNITVLSHMYCKKTIGATFVPVHFYFIV